jgi:hypothetical protein
MGRFFFGLILRFSTEERDIDFLFIRVYKYIYAYKAKPEPPSKPSGQIRILYL